MEEQNKKAAPFTQESYTYEEIIKCGHGELFGKKGPRLPLPPILMFDRITKVSAIGGKYDKGFITAELDISPDLWFFSVHFENDNVMPGCLGLDALWQLAGFFIACVSGSRGNGRALGVGKVRFAGEVLPNSKLVSYRVDFKRILSTTLTLGIGDGIMEVDGKKIYQADDLRAGVFQSQVMGN